MCQIFVYGQIRKNSQQAIFISKKRAKRTEQIRLAQEIDHLTSEIKTFEIEKNEIDGKKIQLDRAIQKLSRLQIQLENVKHILNSI
jgi:hypothetical protein